MDRDDLMRRVVVDPMIAGGKPCIRGTRIYVAVILDGLAEGMTAAELIDHYPSLTVDDIRGALAYGAVLAQENTFRVAG
jgi:uncharacterized protein (DUF433 family)